MSSRSRIDVYIDDDYRHRMANWMRTVEPPADRYLSYVWKDLVDTMDCSDEDHYDYDVGIGACDE